MFPFSSEFCLPPKLKGQIFLQYTTFWTFVNIAVIYEYILPGMYFHKE